MQGPGRVAQSVGHLTRKSGVLGSIPGLATYFRFSFRFFLRRAVVNYWRKYVHEVLVNRLGDLSLPRKSVVRLTDRPDMTLDVYRGRKTTSQQQQQLNARTLNFMEKKSMKYLFDDRWGMIMHIISVKLTLYFKSGKNTKTSPFCFLAKQFSKFQNSKQVQNYHKMLQYSF